MAKKKDHNNNNHDVMSCEVFTEEETRHSVGQQSGQCSGQRDDDNCRNNNCVTTAKRRQQQHTDANNNNNNNNNNATKNTEDQRNNNNNNNNNNSVTTELLLDMVIRGHGDKLIGRWSNQPQLQQFLDQLPYLLDRIQQIHLGATRYSLTDFIMLIDNRQSLVRSLDQCGCTTLHKAIMFNNVEVAEYLIDCFGEQLINQQDKQGRSPLHYAATLTDKHLYMFLLAQNKTRIVLDNRGRTPMYYLEHGEQLQMKNLINLSRKLNANFQTNILSKCKLRSTQQHQHQWQQRCNNNSSQQQPLEHIMRMEWLNNNSSSNNNSNNSNNNNQQQQQREVATESCGSSNNQQRNRIITMGQQCRKLPNLTHHNNYCKSNNTDDCLQRSLESSSSSSSTSSSSSSSAASGLSQLSSRSSDIQQQHQTNRHHRHDQVRSQSEDNNKCRVNIMSLSCNDLTQQVSTSDNERDVNMESRCDLYQDDDHVDIQQQSMAPNNLRSVSMSALFQVQEEKEEQQQLYRYHDNNHNHNNNHTNNNSDNSDPNSEPQIGTQKNELTPNKLHLAIINGDETIVKKLIKKQNRHLIRSEDNNGLMPLHKSVILGHIELSKQLVQSMPVCLNTIDKSGKTALHYAAGLTGESQRILTKFLIGAGINPCIRDNDGHTAEYYRIHSLRLPKEMNSLLEERQLLASLDLNNNSTSTTTNNRASPHTNSSKSMDRTKHSDFVVIRSPKNNNNNSNNNGTKKFKLLSSQQVQLTPRNIRDRIIRCLRDGSLDKINELVLEGYGAFLVEQGRNICWNLHCRQYIKQVIPKLIAATEQLHELILKNDLISIRNLLSYEPILIKIRRNYKQCAMNGAHFACLHNRLNVIKFILDNFPEMIHLRDSQSHTCLHIAAKIKSIELYNILIEYGCSTAATDNKGYTARDYFFDTHNNTTDHAIISHNNKKEASVSELLCREQTKADEIHMTATKMKLLPHNVRFNDKQQTNNSNKQKKKSLVNNEDNSISTVANVDDDNEPDFLASTEEEELNNGYTGNNATRGAPIFNISDQGPTDLATIGNDKLFLNGSTTTGGGYRLRAASAVFLEAPNRVSSRYSDNLSAVQKNNSRRFSDLGGAGGLAFVYSCPVNDQTNQTTIINDSGFLSKRTTTSSLNPMNDDDDNNKQETNNKELNLLQEMTDLGLEEELEVRCDNVSGLNKSTLNNNNNKQADNPNSNSIGFSGEEIAKQHEQEANMMIYSSSSIDDLQQQIHRQSFQRTSDGSMSSPQSQVSIQLPMSRPGSASTINKLQRIIRQAIHEDDINKLEHIIIAGRGQHLLDLYEEEYRQQQSQQRHGQEQGHSNRMDISENMIDFFNNLAHVYMDKVQQIHRMVSEANLEELKKILNKKRLALSRDYYGATPLHLTVVKQQLNIFHFLMSKYPQSMSAPDNEGRLPIHYAAICLNYHSNHHSSSSNNNSTLVDNDNNNNNNQKQKNELSSERLQFMYDELKERGSPYYVSLENISDKMGCTPDQYNGTPEPLCCQRYKELLNRYDKSLEITLKELQTLARVPNENQQPVQQSPDIWRRNENTLKYRADRLINEEGDQLSSTTDDNKELLRNIPQESLSSKLERLDGHQKPVNTTTGEHNNCPKPLELTVTSSSVLGSQQQTDDMTDTDDDRHLEEPSDGRYCHLASPVSDNRPYSASSLVSSVANQQATMDLSAATTTATTTTTTTTTTITMAGVITSVTVQGETTQTETKTGDQIDSGDIGEDDKQKTVEDDHLSVYKRGYLLDTNNDDGLEKIDLTIDENNNNNSENINMSKKKRRASHHSGDDSNGTWKNRNNIHKVSLDIDADNDNCDAILPFITTTLSKSAQQQHQQHQPELGVKNTLIPNKSPRQTMVGGVIIPSIMHNDNMEKVECYDVVYRRCSSFDQRLAQLDNSATTIVNGVGGGPTTTTTNIIMQNTGTSSGSGVSGSSAGAAGSNVKGGSRYDYFDVFNNSDKHQQQQDDDVFRQNSSDEEIERVERLSSEFENTVKREKNELKTRVDQIMNDIRMTAKSIRSTNNILTTNRVTFDSGHIIHNNGRNNVSNKQQQQLTAMNESPLKSSMKQYSISKFGNSVRSSSISSSSSTVTGSSSTGSSLTTSTPSSASSSSYCSSCNKHDDQQQQISSEATDDRKQSTQQQQQQHQQKQHGKLGNNSSYNNNSQLANLAISVPVKNAYGQTYLHFISSRTQNSQTFYKILAHGAQLIPERDIFYRTMRDIGAQFNLLSNVQVIDQFIIDAFVGENIKLLKHLQHQGYSPLIHVADLDGNDIMLILKLLKSNKMIQFLQQLADFQKWRDELHTFIRHGYRHGVSILIKKHFDLVTAKSVYSRTSAHIATLFERIDILEELIRIDKRSIYCTDNMGRTALHYAYGIQSDKADDIRNLLIDAGSDETARDVKMRTPKYYYVFKHEIQDIKKLEYELV